jgi:ribosomal protein S18 acetylase RimI-like enzyme
MDYRIVEGTEKISIAEVVRLLKTTYWAEKRTPEQIEKSVRHSFCYGIYLDDEKKLAAFARVICDQATFYYLCDVIVDEAYRHRGLGKALVAHIVSRPEYKGLRGMLLTRDAHGLYEKFGFERAEARAMVKAPE